MLDRPNGSLLPTTHSPPWAPCEGGHVDKEQEDSGSFAEDRQLVVFLQVYHFHSMTKSLGLPIFHVGVEVGGCEVSFGTSGVRRNRPRSLQQFAHIKTVQLGRTLLSAEEVTAVVDELSLKWPGEDYNLLHFNCQTFAIEFVTRLGLEDRLPVEYVSYSNLFDLGMRALGGASRLTPRDNSAGSKVTMCSCFGGEIHHLPPPDSEAARPVPCTSAPSRAIPKIAPVTPKPSAQEHRVNDAGLSSRSHGKIIMI